MMFEMLNPEYRFSALAKITPEWMRKHHYRALLMDIDNTLLPRNSYVVPEKNIAWLMRMQKQGIALVLASNNGGERVEAIKKQLERNGLSIPILTWAGKPFPRAYDGALRLLESSVASDGDVFADLAKHSSRILAAGDQLFTDVLGAHWYHLPAAWLRPLSKNDFIGTKVLRLLEQWITGRLAEKGLLPEEDLETK